MELPQYVADRVRTPVPAGRQVVAHSTPVVWFGRFRRASVATLGLNPSRQEFYSSRGELLRDAQRRLATTESMGIEQLEVATDEQVAQVVADCDTYFERNPYRRWFDQLDRVLQTATGTSYYDGSACHLDLVQWATDPVWGQITARGAKERLLEADRGFLEAQLRHASLRLVLINGSGVMNAVASTLGLRFERTEDAVAGELSSTVSVAEGFGKRFIAWAKNFQSSRPMTKALKDAIARCVASAIQEIDRDKEP